MVNCVRYVIMFIEVKERNKKHFSVLKCAKKKRKRGRLSMKYTMYNVVWYDGEDAYVSKFVLDTNKEQAEKDLCKLWSLNGYEGEILKIDQLYVVNFENINALNNGDNTQKITFNRFIEMYF